MSIIVSIFTIVLLAFAARAEQRVDLIHPYILSAKFQSGCNPASNATNATCTVLIETRSAKYELRKTDWSRGGSGEFYRISDWTEPKFGEGPEKFVQQEDGKSIPAVEFRKKSELTANVGAPVPQDPLMLRSDTGFLFQQASATFSSGGVDYRIDIRDDEVKFYIVKGNKGCLYGANGTSCIRRTLDQFVENTLGKSGFGLRAPVATYLRDQQSNPTRIILIDILGRALTFNFNVSGGNLAIEHVNVLGTSSVEAQDDSDDVPLFAETKLTDSLREILEGGSVDELQFISPDAVSYSLVKGEPVVCISHSIYNNPKRDPRSRLSCRKNGQKYDRPSLDEVRENQTFQILALHYGEFDKQYYVHMVHRVMNLSSQGTGIDDSVARSSGSGRGKITYSLRYTYCLLSDDTVLKMNGETRWPGEQFPDENCYSIAINTAPSDFVVVKGNSTSGVQCEKLLTIYDHLYTMSIPLGKVTMGPRHILSDQSFPIYVRAAIFKDNYLYLFAHSNRVFKYNVIFGNNCSQRITFELLAEMSASKFLENIWEANPLTSPVFDLYESREFVWGANNTMPPLPMSEMAPSSNISLMVILAIVVGLIVAGLVYAFFLRGGSDEESRKTKRIKSEIAPAFKSPDSSIMKTVRSGRTPLSIEKSKTVNALSPSKIRSKMSKRGSSKSPAKSPSRSPSKRSSKSQNTSKSPASGHSKIKGKKNVRNSK